MSRIEQRRVHDMERQFKQPGSSQGFIRLGGSRAIANRLVVANRRIVISSRALQGHWRLFIKVQPVYSHSDFLASRYSTNLIQFRTPSGTINPSVDTVGPNFAACRDEV